MYITTNTHSVAKVLEAKISIIFEKVTNGFVQKSTELIL